MLSLRHFRLLSIWSLLAGTALAQQAAQLELAPVAMVNTPFGNPVLGSLGSPTGTDDLASGQVTVSRNRQVTFTLRGAVATATYDTMFCRFGFSAGLGCLNLGTLTTDSAGNADSNVSFPSASGTPDTWSGIFVVTRNTGLLTVEYVSGFALEPTPPSPSSGVDLQLTGQIQSLNPASFSLQLVGLPIAIFTDSSTKFSGKGLRDFSGLKVTDEVQVTGFTRPDGTIYATSVQEH